VLKSVGEGLAPHVGTVQSYTNNGMIIIFLKPGLIGIWRIIYFGAKCKAIVLYIYLYFLFTGIYHGSTSSFMTPTRFM
jgi:hypothetical protein